MDLNALTAFNDYVNKGRPSKPSRPFPPLSSSSAADHRKYADELDAYELASKLHTQKNEEYVEERARLHDAVTDSILNEYSKSEFTREALAYILNHSIRETDNMYNAEEMFDGIVQLIRDVNKLNAGEQLI